MYHSVWDVDNEEKAMHGGGGGGQRVYRNLYLAFNFTVNLKLLKNKVY